VTCDLVLFIFVFYVVFIEKEVFCMVKMVVLYDFYLGLSVVE